MWELSIPIRYSTVLVVFIELLYGIFLYPPLTRYAAYLDARYWKNRFRLRPIRWYHILTGGHIFSVHTVSLFVVSVAVAIGFAYSLDSTEIPRTKRGDAVTVKTNNDFSTGADWELTEATRLCSTNELMSMTVYRKPVLYGLNFAGQSDRVKNTRFDRLVGSKFVSCTGSKVGETLPTDEVSRATIRVNTSCCTTCKQERHNMKLYFAVMVTAPDNTTILRPICSPQDTPLLRKAMLEVTTRNITGDPHLMFHSQIIPKYVWKFHRHSKRRYVYRIDDGTHVGISVLMNLLLFLALIWYAVGVIRHLKRQNFGQFHGFGESDIIEWWALAWWKRARDEQRYRMDADNATHKFRIACDLLGWKMVEEKLLDNNLHAFQRDRITINPDHANYEMIPIYPCPICYQHTAT